MSQVDVGDPDGLDPLQKGYYTNQNQRPRMQGGRVPKWRKNNSKDHELEKKRIIMDIKRHQVMLEEYEVISDFYMILGLMSIENAERER